VRERVATASEKRARVAEQRFDEATAEKSSSRPGVLFTPEQRQRVLIRKISARVSNPDPDHDPLASPLALGLDDSILPELAITTLRAIARTKDDGNRTNSFFRSFIVAACVYSSEPDAHNAYLQHLLRLPPKYVQLKNFSSRGYPDWTLLTEKNLTRVMKYLVDLHDAPGGDDAIKNICIQIVPKGQLDILFGGSPGAGGGGDGGEIVAAAVPQNEERERHLAAGGYRKSRRSSQQFSRRTRRTRRSNK
jgi:hypothetical protein